MINMKSKKFYVLVFQSNYNEQDKKKKNHKKAPIQGCYRKTQTIKNVFVVT